MKECLNFLRALSWPIVRDDSKLINTDVLSRFVRQYYTEELRFEYDIPFKERDKMARDSTLEFLKNFKTIKEDGWDVTLGIGKLTPKEMDDAFGYPKNPNPGHTYFAGRETRSKDNPADLDS